MARILIVDDETTDRILERSILENAGHELFSAADGKADAKKANASPNTTDDRTAPGSLIGDLIGPSIAGTRRGVNGKSVVGRVSL